MSISVFDFGSDYRLGKRKFVCRVTDTETEPESDNDKVLLGFGLYDFHIMDILFL